MALSYELDVNKFKVWTKELGGSVSSIGNDVSITRNGFIIIGGEHLEHFDRYISLLYDQSSDYFAIKPAVSRTRNSYTISRSTRMKGGLINAGSFVIALSLKSGRHSATWSDQDKMLLIRTIQAD
jgi:hypothetical protein